ncbi:MAG: U32 family peptidase [Clostridia bacterium]
MEKPELLAPCGDINALNCAVFNGADAVYFGLQSFNARMKAENFNESNIAETVKFCHLFGVRAYITVNTSIKNNEIETLKALILSCKNANVDAFIISDLAVLETIKDIAPQIPVHASTQLGICNLEGAKFIENLGITRVVLAREVKIEDIIEIKNNTNLEIEYFIQGALCVAFSGKCLFSSIVNGNSGNRGRCLQPCRLLYTEKQSGNDGYLLSTADLCLARQLSKLNEAGVTSFKIEGRLRKESYVATTTKIYRKIIDNDFLVENSDIETLKSAYNRGDFSSGYAFEKDTNKIMSTKIQGNIGIKVGVIEGISQVRGEKLCKVSTTYELNINDGYKIIGRDGFEVSGGKIQNIQKSSNGYLIKLDEANVGDTLHITASQNFIVPKNRLPLDIFFSVDESGYASILLTSKGQQSFVKSNKSFEPAKTTSLTEIDAKRALSKIGNTYFEVKNWDCEILSSVFAPVSLLNELRRQSIELLENNILESYNLTKKCAKSIILPESTMKNALNHSSGIAVELQDIEQLSDYIVNKSDYIIFYPFNFTVDYVKKFIEKAKQFNKLVKIFLKLTPNASVDDMKIFREIISENQDNLFGLYAENVYTIQLAKEYNLQTFLGIGLNIFNNILLKNLCATPFYVVSAELNSKEIASFENPFVFSYGYLPLMNLSHCVEKLNHNFSSCGKCSYTGKITYVDRKNYEFCLFRNKVSNCYFTLYNSVKTDISSKFINNAYNFYLNMIQCNVTEAETALNAFINKIPLNSNSFTYGHLIRGVE